MNYYRWKINEEKKIGYLFSPRCQNLLACIWPFTRPCSKATYCKSRPMTVSSEAAAAFPTDTAAPWLCLFSTTRRLFSLGWVFEIAMLLTFFYYQKEGGAAQQPAFWVWAASLYSLSLQGSAWKMGSCACWNTYYWPHFPTSNGVVKASSCQEHFQIRPYFAQLASKAERPTLTRQSWI